MEFPDKKYRTAGFFKNPKIVFNSVMMFCPVFFVLDAFGFKERRIEVSTRPKDSIGTEDDWNRATQALKGALESKGIEYEICEGEGAFYGPKIDIQIKDVLGRAWQCSTIQCDFALPERFELEYAGSDGARHRPVMLHRAILGSIERFLGVLIEHTAGALPLWLSPVQAVVIPVSQAQEAYGREVLAKLVDEGLRARLETADQTLGSRIRAAQGEKIPYMLVVGDREAKAGKVAVRSRSRGVEGPMGLSEFVAKVKKEAEEKQ
jgi:threonyl-tRNA synthetase